ncbi:ATP-grasp peptide maturase system methyltransferase [Streptomyces sp. DSM 42041]|uniref:Protein-L-isoaspartate O-methyltransferase n=1 Tax=Streptomyces hazeniae TaxID=3075538 RepID=A0ABU2NQB2_9ACTN|nr:ATP-grasp peptide maturase system methyltransferase [Streptomyces sp. DSM 42041]MDT0378398.1 ATP-grasp peptide maturase system methyltransferase [Streptomyces sp. DSM 42041]
MNRPVDTFRAELAAALFDRGTLRDNRWRAAVEQVPRELFLGPAVYRQTGRGWEPLLRDSCPPEEWLRTAYTDATLVTQIDGLNAADAPGPVSGSPTSSSTLPSLVIRMLELAGIREGEKVLEIGTGTGYSTSLLCHRIGEGNVYSIEYDPALATLAADRIHSAGYQPHLVTGDGLNGHPPGADYDRIVLTCALRSVPLPLLWQLADTGSITFGLGGWMQAAGLINLTIAEDGTFTGRFTGEPLSYMLARPHQPPPRPKFFPVAGEPRPTRIDPELTQSWTGRFVAQLSSPSAEMIATADNVILIDVATGSQSWTEPDGTSSWRVHQHGPLRLWDQVEQGIGAWQRAGMPDQSDFGMTISEDDTQTVWIGAPSGTSWTLPA